MPHPLHGWILFICTETNKLSHILIGGNVFAGFGNQGVLLFRVTIGHGTRDGTQNINCRITVALGNGAVKDDMSVQNGTNGIGNRFIMVIAVNQNRNNPVMVPLPEPGPARSSKRGSSANTLGVYPFEAGGSPTDRDISRWAMANG